MIKKIIIKGAWVGDEKELIAKQGKNKGKKFMVCKIGLFAPDEDAEFGGKFIGGSTFADEKGKRTAKKVAEDLKAEIEASGGKEFFLDIEKSISEKDGKEYINFKFPNKAAIEAVKPYIK